MPSTLAGVVLAGLLLQGTDSADAALAGADARAARGDLAGAAADYRVLLETNRGPRPLVLYRLADLERRTGDHPAAVRHAVEAAALLHRRGDLRNASEAMNVAGLAESNQGHYAESISRFQEAMDYSREAGDWARHAEQVSNLGTVYFPLGRYDEAADAFRRARTLAESHKGAAWAASRQAIALANEAALLQRLGRYNDALVLYRTMVGDGGVLAPAQRGQVLVNQGALFRRMGDPYKALDAYASARLDFVLADDAAGEATVLTNRGIALALDLARPGEAALTFGAALDVARARGIRREALLAQLYRGEALFRDGRPGEAQPDFDAAQTLAAELGAREEQWKALFGLGRVAMTAGRDAEGRSHFDRAIVLIEQLREQLAVPATRLEFFQDKREVYDARIAAGLATDTPATTFALIEGSRARAWRDRMTLGPVSLEAVQAAVPADTVLLSYWVSSVGSAVVRVTRHDARVLPLVLDTTDLRALDAALRRPNGPWAASAAKLGRALVPGDVLGETSRLVVIPDGSLGAVPFDTLTVEGTALADRVAVSILPTAALLLVPAGEAPAAWRWRAPWSLQLAAFGDPLPATASPAGEAPAGRLAASASEVQAVSAALGGAHRLFLGANNQKSALVALLASPPPVLHLATHATADLAAGESSRVLFSPPAAGAPAASLFLREVYALTLTGVDLVVLSACETERGPEVRGEGVQGFSRGLLAAGARRAVTTLWQVPDGPTAQLMHHFYGAVQRGLPLDVALADAKRALKANPQFSHPHYWAAFVLTGPADALPKALRWRDLAGAGLIMLGLAATAVVWRRRHRGRAAAGRGL